MQKLVIVAVVLIVQISQVALADRRIEAHAVIDKVENQLLAAMAHGLAAPATEMLWLIAFARDFYIFNQPVTRLAKTVDSERTEFGTVDIDHYESGIHASFFRNGKNGNLFVDLSVKFPLPITAFGMTTQLFNASLRLDITGKEAGLELIFQEDAQGLTQRKRVYHFDLEPVRQRKVPSCIRALRARRAKWNEIRYQMVDLNY